VSEGKPDKVLPAGWMPERTSCSWTIVPVIVVVVSQVPDSGLRAPARPPAVPAAVAGAIAAHDRAALSACRSVTLGFTPSVRPQVGGRRSRSLNSGARWGRRRRREKPQCKPAGDVVHNRLGVADLLDARPAARLESCVAELVTPELCTGGGPSWHLRQRFDLDFAFHGSDSDLSFASRC